MKIFYWIYQICVCLPLGLLATLITALVTIIGCMVGDGHFWGYYPGRLWARVIIRLFLLPVRVEGRENLEKGHSYIFVANHQGAFDIFLIYGFLNRNFKWMMKSELRKIPFVGVACEKAHHIFVYRHGSKHIHDAVDRGREVLQSGMSLVVFPEGSRTRTGEMAPFKKGAFVLADELQLPIVPLTINGSFRVMPRQKDFHFVHWNSLSLTIHQPIYPVGQGPENLQAVLSQAYDSVQSSLDLN